jgi:hypothetical protein
LIDTATVGVTVSTVNGGVLPPVLASNVNSDTTKFPLPY